MRIKIERKKIIPVYEVLCDLVLKGGKQDIKFNYAVIKNKNFLEKEIIDIKIEFQKFELERDDLCRKYCEKDEKGNPVIVNNNYAGLEKHKEFKKELSIYMKKKEEYENSEICIDAYMIQKETFPKQIEAVYQEALYYFVSMEDFLKEE